jgi:cytochrome P450
MCRRRCGRRESALGDVRCGGRGYRRLPLTRAVIEEALRLYPPGAVLSRTALRDDRLSAATIRPGDTVMIPVWALHRHRKLWDAPDAFRPDRWLEEPVVAREAPRGAMRPAVRAFAVHSASSVSRSGCARRVEPAEPLGKA